MGRRPAAAADDALTVQTGPETHDARCSVPTAVEPTDRRGPRNFGADGEIGHDRRERPHQPAAVIDRHDRPTGRPATDPAKATCPSAGERTTSPDARSTLRCPGPYSCAGAS